MANERETAVVAPAPAAGSFAALLREVRRGSHWAQLIRFGVVGVSGYVLNLAVYWIGLRAGLEYREAATAAFAVALVNNFGWNRMWTFPGAAGRLHGQAFRFVVVSVAAFLLSLAILSVLVRDAGVAKVLAQAIAIIAVTPFSFLANKFWSFRTSPA